MKLHKRSVELIIKNSTRYTTVTENNHIKLLTAHNQLLITFSDKGNNYFP